MLELQRVSEPMKFVCTKIYGDCPIGKRNKDGFCLHTKYCSGKKSVSFDKFIVDREENKSEKKFVQQKLW